MSWSLSVAGRGIPGIAGSSPGMGVLVMGEPRMEDASERPGTGEPVCAVSAPEDPGANMPGLDPDSGAEAGPAAAVPEEDASSARLSGDS